MPAGPSYSLVGWIDGITLLRRDLAAVIEPVDAGRDLGRELRSLGGLSDLPAQGIFDRGRLIGLWEYDTDAAEIAWGTFAAADDALRAAVARTEAFVREQLGDARGSSLDNPGRRKPRIEALRALGQTG